MEKAREEADGEGRERIAAERSGGGLDWDRDAREGKALAALPGTGKETHTGSPTGRLDSLDAYKLQGGRGRGE